MRRTIIFGCIGVVLTILSCSRQVPTEPEPEPDYPPTPYNVAIGYGQQSVTLTWEIANPALVSRYRVYVGDSTLSNFALRDSTTNRTITLGGMQYNRRYSFQIAAIGINKIEGKRSTPVAARMPILGVSIDNGNEYTRDRTVQLALTAESATHVYLSEDDTFVGAQPQTYSPTKNFVVSAGDGPKRVYARFVFADGGQTTDPIYDDITMDTKATIESVTFQPPGQIFTAGDIVIFLLTAGELGGVASVSFGTVSQYFLYDDGTNGDQEADDGIYSATYIVPVDMVVANELVEGSFTDAAGNQALQRSSTLPLTIQPAPQPPKLNKPEPLSTYEMRVTWTASPSGNIDFYRLYRDTQRNVTTASTLATSLPPASTLAFTDTSLNDNTKYFYKVYAVASTGAMAASNLDSGTTLINTPPEAVVLAGSLSDTATVNLTWSQSTEDDFKAYRIYRRTSTPVDTANGQLIGLINSRTSTSYSNSAADLTTVYYRVFVFDRHGAATGSNTVQINK